MIKLMINAQSIHCNAVAREANATVMATTLDGYVPAYGAFFRPATSRPFNDSLASAQDTVHI
jgi:hypothetical protein